MSALLQAAGKRPLTLLYGARNTEHNRPWRCGRRCWRMRAGRRARGLIPAPPAPLFGRTRAAMPAGAIFRILNVRYARLEPRTATPQSIDGLRLQDRYARTTQGALQRYRHGNARDPVPLQKELDHVPHILQDGEQVLAFATGLMNNDTWLITLTDRRIIFLDKGMVYGLRQAVIDRTKSAPSPSPPAGCSATSTSGTAPAPTRSPTSGRNRSCRSPTACSRPWTRASQPTTPCRSTSCRPATRQRRGVRRAPCARATRRPAAAEEDIIEAAEVAGASRAHDTISVAAGIPEAAHAPQASASPVTPASPASQVRSDDEIISKLERLSALRDRGVLTDKEFAAQKTRILGA